MSATPATASTEVKVLPAPAPITLAGKVAIVTGASRGIGASIALRLARDGAKVIVNYQKDVKSATAVVTAINSVKDGTAAAIQADVSKSTEVDRLFAETKRLFGRVDIVIANSGVGGNGASIATTTNEEYDRVISTNLTGVFYTLRAAANIVENNGRIMVIGSGLKYGTSPNWGAYSATKAAIEVLSNTLAQELGSKGITVNAIHPGAVDTDMLNASINGNDGVRQYFVNLTPFKRLGTSADLGDAVALFASESARWISGQSIHVNGASKV